MLFHVCFVCLVKKIQAMVKAINDYFVHSEVVYFTWIYCSFLNLPHFGFVFLFDII